MLCSGTEQFVDWSAAYRLFSKKRINRDEMFSPARGAVMERLAENEPLVVMMDDTLIRKRGHKIHGTGWKRDPLGPPFCTNFVWGQRFLQISAALPDIKQWGRARGIPVDFVHAPSAVKPGKKAPERAWEEYRQQQETTKISTVAAKRLHALRQRVAHRQIICAVDGGFTNRALFRQLPDDTTLIGRIRKDARLFMPPEKEMIPRRGRRRWYGTALPTPEQIRQDESIPWQTVEAFAAGKRHQFAVKCIPAARWAGTGEHTVSIVIMRPLAYRLCKSHRLLYRNPAYLLCTDPDLPLERLLQAYLWRWEIELNFRDEKTVLGVGQAQVRKNTSTETVPAFLVASYALLLLAGSAEATTQTCLPRPKWRRANPTERISTQQMLSLFRAGLWKIAVSTNLRHFDVQNPGEQTPFYSSKSLASAACYATK
jgi:hypothetical protein